MDQAPINNLSRSPRLRLSQGDLSRLERCPRQFQYAHLDHLAGYIPPEQEAAMQWGKQFHQVVEQQVLGLPIARLLNSDPQLASSFSALQQAAPDVFDPQALGQSCLRLPEHPRSFTLEIADQSIQFTVVYDLLMTQPNQAQILDWKTHRNPQRRDRLQSAWQTRLYLFALAETSDYQPEQISMTYWFVRPQCDDQIDRPQCQTFTYSDVWHQQTRQALETLLAPLPDWLLAYEQGEALPQVSEAAGYCGTCPFALRCWRSSSTKYQTDDLTDLASWLSEVETIAEFTVIDLIP